MAFLYVLWLIIVAAATEYVKTQDQSITEAVIKRVFLKLQSNFNKLVTKQNGSRLQTIQRNPGWLAKEVSFAAPVPCTTATVVSPARVAVTRSSKLFESQAESKAEIQAVSQEGVKLKTADSELASVLSPLTLQTTGFAVVGEEGAQNPPKPETRRQHGVVARGGPVRLKNTKILGRPALPYSLKSRRSQYRHVQRLTAEAGNDINQCLKGKLLPQP